MPDSLTNINFKNVVIISDHEFVIEFTYRYRVRLNDVYKNDEGNFFYAFDSIYTGLIERAQKEYAAGTLRKPQSFAGYRKEWTDEMTLLLANFDRPKDQA